jgi:hypothetical protein
MQCSLFPVCCGLSKLNVAGSILVSCSIKSITYRQMSKSWHPQIPSGTLASAVTPRLILRRPAPSIANELDFDLSGFVAAEATKTGLANRGPEINGPSHGAEAFRVRIAKRAVRH